MFKQCLNDHNLIQIYSSGYSNTMDVVRWCKNCGAVVVDLDFDGRTRPGAIVPLMVPASYYDK